MCRIIIKLLNYLEFWYSNFFIFGILIFLYLTVKIVCTVYSRCDFVTARCNIWGCNFKYFCIVVKKASQEANQNLKKKYDEAVIIT